MLELLDFSITGINVIPTVLMIFVIIYWLIVILGVIDVDTVDVDLDLDVDADMDVEVEIGGLASVLSFFNIGHMPLMIFITFFSLPLWVSTILVNDFFGIQSLLPGLITFVPLFIGSLFVAKFLTIPIAKFYRKIRQDTEAVKYIVGQLCIAKLPISDSSLSQAEIKVNGTSVLINAKTRNGLTIAKGEKGLVIEQNEVEKFYYVEPYA